MLAGYATAVLQLCRQVQIIVDHGAYRAEYVDQLREQENDRVEVLVVIQVATGKNQVAGAGATQIEIIRHGLAEIAQLVAHEPAHGVGDGVHQRFLSPDHQIEPGQQFAGRLIIGKAIGK